MKSKYLEEFENEANHSLQLYVPSIMNLITQNYMDKIIIHDETREFSFRNLYNAENKVQHKIAEGFVKAAREKFIDEKKNYDFISHLREIIGSEFYPAMGFQLISGLISIPFPFLLKIYLIWFQSPDSDNLTGYGLASLFCLASLLQVILKQFSKKGMAFSQAQITVVNKVLKL